MLDMTSPRDRVIAAALRLAETRGWSDLGLGDIAAEAGMPLIEFRDVFASKAAILAAFSDAIDRDVLRKFAAQTTDAPRDRVFDVVISRFESMMPFKPAIKRIVEDGGASLGQIGPALRSQYWMLAAAGVDAEGTLGMLRVQGMLSIYSSVFGIWLEDEDTGMARTMAALDRRLRRAETNIARIERFGQGLRNLGRTIRGGSKPNNVTGDSGLDASSAPGQVIH